MADEAIDRLRHRVRLSPFEPLPPAPHDRPALVTLTFTDGAVSDSTCLSAVGGPDRPLSEPQVLDKIALLTGSTAPAFEDFARSLVHGPSVDPGSWSAALDSMVLDSAARDEAPR